MSVTEEELSLSLKQVEDLYNTSRVSQEKRLNKVSKQLEVIEMTLRKMDDDRDGRISFSDFSSSVTKEPLMMEAFGPCLPNNRAGGEFIRNILETPPNGILYYA